ncbi:MAG TPA: cobalamin biosynthesis protein, partial [Acidimicrobiales bacterium]|nr:cobalamin biosynthesis protein [Acidimicrobiales bacterium]
MGRRALGSAAGLAADRLVGEPPMTPHPVALFGRTMRAVERRLYVDARPAGVMHAVAGVGLGTLAGLALASTVPATYLAVAGRALGEA